VAFPSVSQRGHALTVSLFKKFRGHDAICSEVPKIVTQLAPGS
jgi:hypothetical protein